MTTLFSTAQEYLYGTRQPFTIDRQVNNSYARKVTLLLFLVRIFMFKFCLTVPSSNETFTSARWTLLQVCPHVLYKDIFNLLAMKPFDLVDHDEPRISKLVRDEYEEAKSSLLKSGCQPIIKDDTRLLVVHDEAQLLGDAFNGSFQSMSSSDDSPRPLLSPILTRFETSASISWSTQTPAPAQAVTWGARNTRPQPALLQRRQMSSSSTTQDRLFHTHGPAADASWTLCIDISPRNGKTPKSRQGQVPRASSARNAQREGHPLLATGGSWTRRSATDGAVPHATTTLSSSSTTLSKEKATDHQVRLNLHSQSLTHKVPVELGDSPKLSPPPFFQPTTMIEESDDEERLVRNTRKNRSMYGLDYGSCALGDPVLPYNDICDFDQETGKEMGNIHQDAHYDQGDLDTSVNNGY